MTSWEEEQSWRFSTDNDEECVVTDEFGEWHDRKCEDRYKVLCQVDPLPDTGIIA